MTESDAKKLWCPFARIAHVNAPTGGNRHYSGVGAEENLGIVTRCIGSQCMAWRWNKPEDNIRQYVDDDGLMIVETGRKGMGFCGLAGKS